MTSPGRYDTPGALVTPRDSAPATAGAASAAAARSVVARDDGFSIGGRGERCAVPSVQHCRREEVAEQAPNVPSLTQNRFFGRDEYFMRLALREAERAPAHEDVPVGAVVVHRGEVIGAGHN